MLDTDEGVPSLTHYNNINSKVIISNNVIPCNQKNVIPYHLLQSQTCLVCEVLHKSRFDIEFMFVYAGAQNNRHNVKILPHY